MTAHVGTIRQQTAHRQRRHWHVLLRYWRQRINYILLAGLVAVLLVLAVAVPAEAQTTVRCRWPWQPAKILMANGRYGWTCIYVWEGRR